ncbi:HAD family hydrolase [Desulfovibrio psychrotolerans]|uniref:Haloacid dehalogenase n=1 Tax=Desulfovibrio psychrotolerans TaxID=415242 RepID=A0A7J0BQ77_9BACT|nr:ATPase P [Desulfovibrio psychrotolerans]GFM35819.1 hypothetical protein DSM19430T_05030 [Desulfovibrio psychrotolerans]
MLQITIPGGASLALETLVLDYNGTVALDGELLPGVAERLTRLAPALRIVVLTADTHGTVTRAMQGLPAEVMVIGPSGGKNGNAAPQKPECSSVPASIPQDSAKLQALLRLDATRCVAFGNGRNDGLMLRRAALAVAVMGREGVAAEALLAAHVTVYSIEDGLDLLLHPDRLRATLRC